MASLSTGSFPVQGAAKKKIKPTNKIMSLQKKINIRILCLSIVQGFGKTVIENLIISDFEVDYKMISILLNKASN